MKITNKLAALSGIALLSLTGAAQALTLSTFTNLGNWQTAVALIGTELGPETFTRDTELAITANVFTTTPDGFFQVKFTDTGSGTNASKFLATDTFFLDWRKNKTTLIEFKFATPIIAFGADFFQLDDQDLTVKVDTASINIDAITTKNLATPQFVGFTSDTPFTTLSFTAKLDKDTQFNIDTARWATPAAVPVPAAVWLMGSALIGLIGIGRRKKTV